MIRGVIIDLDGTLVESKDALLRHYLEFLKRYGHTGSREEFDTLNLPLKDVVAYLETKYDLPHNLLEQYKKGLPRIPPLRKGVLDFFHFAKLNGLKLVLATAGSPDYANPILEHYKLPFDAVLTESRHKLRDGLNALNLPADEVIHFDDAILDPDWQKLIHSIQNVNYRVLYRDTDLKIEIIPDGLTLTPSQQTEVDRIWDAATRENPHLFNGRILQFLSLENGTLKGAYVDYKLFLAKFRGLPLPLTAVCLSGITTYQNKLLIARRSSTVSQYPHAYELVPAGSFDDSSHRWQDHILTELTEEAAIPPSQIASLTLHSVVHDLRDDIVEIVAAIDLSSPAFHTTSETAEIKFYDPEDKHKPFVPFSHYLLTSIIS